MLMLGRIDDFDEAYLNGERIGKTGKMPQRASDARESNDYTKLRAYRIPSGLLMPGRENVLAVRVFDRFLHGGIYDGPIGIVTRDHYNRYARSIQSTKNWFQDLLESIFH
jgi:sialate O-acetylesterase